MCIIVSMSRTVFSEREKTFSSGVVTEVTVLEASDMAPSMIRRSSDESMP
jgi:hypothetical protein